MPDETITSRVARMLRWIATNVCNFFLFCLSIVLAGTVGHNVIEWLKTGQWPYYSTASLIENEFGLMPHQTGWVQVDKAILWFLGWPGDLTICFGIVWMIGVLLSAKEKLSDRIF